LETTERESYEGLRYVESGSVGKWNSWELISACVDKHRRYSYSHVDYGNIHANVIIGTCALTHRHTHTHNTHVGTNTHMTLGLLWLPDPPSILAHVLEALNLI